MAPRTRKDRMDRMCKIIEDGVCPYCKESGQCIPGEGMQDGRHVNVHYWCSGCRNSWVLIYTLAAIGMDDQEATNAGG
jgi:hypothetical protein